MKVFFRGLVLEDTYRTKGLRRKLIEEIRSKGIKDEKVLEAMEKVPRHFFLDSSFIEFAYGDHPFSIGEGQTISQPYTVAYQTELLEVKPGMKVLEIGTGSGYQAAILAEMGARVFTIERIQKLYLKAKELLAAMGYHAIRCFYRDGTEGLSTYAPFDRIIVTAAASSIPDKLVDQLVEGGILVVPVDDGPGVQVMKKIVKEKNGQIMVQDFGYFRFVPLLKNKG
ncbi:MAG: protein-L-isoaspartate(D-aspartate) O-methyltransferase [Bacteroidales bacterium]|nr:protein-L-isoaspartate(D-aspartate) O-methyltransferase [Bacteroidales bacterium]